VMCFMEMSGCVFVLRIITAADMTTSEAEPEMYPGIAHFEALFTAIRCPRLDIRFDLVQMRAGCHAESYIIVSCINRTQLSFHK
jgi:hypothetical protein